MNNLENLIRLVGTDTSGKWMRLDQVEELSKLIVQECAFISRKSSKRIDDMGSLIAQDIEKHFGVEQ